MRSDPVKHWAESSQVLIVPMAWAEGMTAESARATKSFIILDVLPGRETVRKRTTGEFHAKQNALCRIRPGGRHMCSPARRVSRAVAAACAQERAPGRKGGGPPAGAV